MIIYLELGGKKFLYQREGGNLKKTAKSKSPVFLDEITCWVLGRIIYPFRYICVCVCICVWSVCVCVRCVCKSREPPGGNLKFRKVVIIPSPAHLNSPLPLFFTSTPVFFLQILNHRQPTLHNYLLPCLSAHNFLGANQNQG